MFWDIYQVYIVVSSNVYMCTRKYAWRNEHGKQFKFKWLIYPQVLLKWKRLGFKTKAMMWPESRISCISWTRTNSSRSTTTSIRESSLVNTDFKSSGGSRKIMCSISVAILPSYFRICVHIYFSSKNTVQKLIRGTDVIIVKISNNKLQNQLKKSSR